MNIYTIAFCSVFLLAACGGGGGSSAPVSQEPAPVAAPASNAEIVTDEPITLHRKNPLETVSGSDIITSNASSSNDIVVPVGFTLDTEQYFELSVSHPNLNADSYLSVCTDYRVEDDGSFNINYDSCVIRTSLEYQELHTDIAVTNDVSNLVAALWFLDTTIEPIYVEWTLADITD